MKENKKNHQGFLQLKIAELKGVRTKNTDFFLSIVSPNFLGIFFFQMTRKRMISA